MQVIPTSTPINFAAVNAKRLRFKSTALDIQAAQGTFKAAEYLRSKAVPVDSAMQILCKGSKTVCAPSRAMG